MSVTAFLATKACFGACVALYNLVEGDAPDAFEGFGIATGSVFAHYWTKRGEAASIEKMCKLLERDLQTHLDAERVEDGSAILADLHEFGPKFIGSAKAVTVAELVQEASGRPDALTGIVLQRAQAALPEDKGNWSDWQRDFVDTHSNRQTALKFLLDCIHEKLYGLKSRFEELVVEQLAQAHEKLNRVDDRQDALHKWLTEEQYAKSSEIEGLTEQLAAANAQIEEMAAREANNPGLASEALAEHDPNKGYDALIAEADTILSKSKKAAAATLRNAGALAFMNDTQDALNAYRYATELDPDDMDSWNQLGLLQRRVGEFAEAERAYIRVGELAKAQGNKEGEAISYGNLGNLYRTRGDLVRTEEAHEKSLKLDIQLGRKQGIAASFGNLGLLYSARGELNRAEEAFEESLRLETELGRKEGTANQYGNLGNLYRVRGDLDQAEAAYEKNLELEMQLGRREGMANNHSNRGTLFLQRGKLEYAEEAFEKSISIESELGRKEGVARNYGNLGIVYIQQGKLDHAKEAIEKGLAINIELGRKEGIAHNYGDLGNLYLIRGELARAEEAYEKSLAINADVGNKEGVAIQCTNLGVLYKKRGEVQIACKSWQKARNLYAETGVAHRIKMVDELMREAGCDIDEVL